jgi:hypothetical protein
MTIAEAIVARSACSTYVGPWLVRRFRLDRVLGWPEIQRIVMTVCGWDKRDRYAIALAKCYANAFRLSAAELTLFAMHLSTEPGDDSRFAAHELATLALRRKRKRE